MTFPVWVEIVCANCARVNVGRYVCNGRIPLRALKKEAKDAGYVFKNGEAYCCQSCADEAEE